VADGGAGWEDHEEDHEVDEVDQRGASGAFIGAKQRGVPGAVVGAGLWRSRSRKRLRTVARAEGSGVHERSGISIISVVRSGGMSEGLAALLVRAAGAGLMPAAPD
jgi:hypothetical protein